MPKGIGRSFSLAGQKEPKIMTWINEREVISSLLRSRSEKNTNKEEEEER